MRRYIKTNKLNTKLYFKQKNWVFTGQIPYEYSIWSRWRDLNPQPLRPERSALPNWATSRYLIFVFLFVGCYVVISFFWSIFQNFWNDVIPSVSRLVAFFEFWSNRGNCVFPNVALFLLQYSRLARYSLRDTPYCATPYPSLHPPPAALGNVPKLSHISLFCFLFIKS